MPVLIRENRVISMFRDVPNKFRIVFSILVVIFWVASWTFFLYFPSVRKVNTFKNNIEELEKSKLAFSHIGIQEDLIKERKVYTVQENINFIWKLISDNNLECKKLSPNFKAKKSDFNLVMNGEFESIVNFLSEIKKTDRGFLIKKFNVVPINNGNIEIDMGLKVV